MADVRVIQAGKHNKPCSRCDAALRHSGIGKRGAVVADCTDCAAEEEEEAEDLASSSTYGRVMMRRTVINRYWF